MPPEHPLSALYGMRTPAQGRVLRALRPRERELAARVRAERGDLERLGALSAPLAAAAAGAGSVPTLPTPKELEATSALEAIPDGPVEDRPARLFLGSIGACVPPPMDYEWSYGAMWPQGPIGDGPPNLIDADAEKATGQVRVLADVAGHHTGTMHGQAGVGVFFRPMVASGTLDVVATVTLSYRWWTYTFAAPVRSAGYVEVIVLQHEAPPTGFRDGGGTGYTLELWNDRSSLGGAGTHTGGRWRLPLTARMAVDRDHWYSLWVVCGGSVGGLGPLRAPGLRPGRGGLLLPGGLARAEIAMRVHEICWELS